MGAAFHIEPFPFDRVFSATPMRRAGDAQALAGEIERLEGELERLKREHEAALLAVRVEAYQEGLIQARADRESALLSAADALQASIEALDTRFGDVEEQLARESAEIALAAADYLAARALEIDPSIGIDAAIGRALAQVRRGTPIQVAVHPDLLPDMEALVAQRQANDRRRLFLTVIADPALPMGDARLRWDQGGALLDASARRDAVRQELGALFPLPAPAAQAA